MVEDAPAVLAGIFSTPDDVEAAGSGVAEDSELAAVELTMGSKTGRA